MPFRFGVVAAPQSGADQWLATARRAEELGYSTLLTPDNLYLPSPSVSLAIAAGATTTLRVGTFVYAGPLRTPRATAWEAHSLALLTGGRFELGIGTGLPSMREQAEELGLPYGDAAERLEQIGTTIDHVRRLDGEQHTPVMIAARGPKARALAAARADIAMLSFDTLETRAGAKAIIDDIRTAAGDRELEYAMNIFVVGEEIPPWIQRFIGAGIETLIKHDSLTMVRGSIDEMAAELERRRDEFGVSYVTVNGAFMEEFAPLVERLAGK